MSGKTRYSRGLIRRIMRAHPFDARRIISQERDRIRCELMDIESIEFELRIAEFADSPDDIADESMACKMARESTGTHFAGPDEYNKTFYQTKRGGLRTWAKRLFAEKRKRNRGCAS